MNRCRWCRSAELETVEYIETSLFGESVRVVIVFCETCGISEQVSTDTVMTPA